MSLEAASHKASDLRFIKDIAFSYVGPFILRIRSFLLIPLIIHALGIEGYGIWSQFEVTLSLFLAIATLNLRDGMNRFLAGDIPKEQLSDDVLSVLAIQLAFTLLLSIPLLIWPSLAARLLFGDERLFRVSICLVLSSISSIIGNCFWGMMRAQRHNKEIAAINAIRWWCELGVLVLTLYFVRSITALFIALTVSQILSNSMYPLYSFRKGWWSFALPRFVRTREYLRFSLPLLGQSISFWALNSIDKYFVRAILGIEAAGIYAALYKFGNLAILLLDPVTEVLLPDVASLYDTGKFDAMQRRLRLTLKYYTLISFTAIIGMVGSSRLLLVIVGLSSTDISRLTSILLLLALGSTLIGQGRILLDGLMVKKRTISVGNIWIGMALLYAVSLFLLVSSGTLGVALAGVLTPLIGLLVIDRIVRSLYSQLVAWKGWGWKVIVAFSVGLLSAWLLSTQVVWLLPIGALVGLVAFLALLLIMGVIGFKEVNYVLSSANRRG